VNQFQNLDIRFLFNPLSKYILIKNISIPVTHLRAVLRTDLLTGGRRKINLQIFFPTSWQLFIKYWVFSIIWLKCFLLCCPIDIFPSGLNFDSYFFLDIFTLLISFGWPNYCRHISAINIIFNPILFNNCILCQIVVILPSILARRFKFLAWIFNFSVVIFVLVRIDLCQKKITDPQNTESREYVARYKLACAMRNTRHQFWIICLF
jgi:hypothetical protein